MNTSTSNGWRNRTHMSERPLEVIHDMSKVREASYKHRPDKPTGFWYQTGREWEKWCEGNMEHWLTPHLSIISVNLDKFKVIRNAWEMENFANEYKDEERQVLTSLSRYHQAIDWKRVMSEYSGIEISPYIHAARMHMFWYYTWDVASGCVWDNDAIKIVKNVPRPRHFERTPTEEFAW
jgi:hypothetical protein